MRGKTGVFLCNLCLVKKMAGIERENETSGKRGE